MKRPCFALSLLLASLAMCLFMAEPRRAAASTFGELAWSIGLEKKVDDEATPVCPWAPGAQEENSSDLEVLAEGEAETSPAGEVEEAAASDASGESAALPPYRSFYDAYADIGGMDDGYNDEAEYEYHYTYEGETYDATTADNVEVETVVADEPAASDEIATAPAVSSVPSDADLIFEDPAEAAAPTEVEEVNETPPDAPADAASAQVVELSDIYGAEFAPETPATSEEEQAEGAEYSYEDYEYDYGYDYSQDESDVAEEVTEDDESEDGDDVTEDDEAIDEATDDESDDDASDDEESEHEATENRVPEWFEDYSYFYEEGVTQQTDETVSEEVVSEEVTPEAETEAAALRDEDLNWSDEAPAPDASADYTTPDAEASPAKATQTPTFEELRSEYGSDYAEAYYDWLGEDVEVVEETDEAVDEVESQPAAEIAPEEEAVPAEEANEPAGENRLSSFNISTMCDACQKQLAVVSDALDEVGAVIRVAWTGLSESSPGDAVRR